MNYIVHLTKGTTGNLIRTTRAVESDIKPDVVNAPQIEALFRKTYPEMSAWRVNRVSYRQY